MATTKAAPKQPVKPTPAPLDGYYEVVADCWVVLPGGNRTLLKAAGVLRAEQVGGALGIAALRAQGAKLKPYTP